MANLNEIQIYSLSDPRTNEIRYIGKTNQSLQRRLNNHISIGNGNRHKSKCINWIKSLSKLQLIPKIENIDYVNDNEWIFWEQHYISLYKSWGCNLTNMTPGGDGRKNHITSKETKTKISLASKKLGYYNSGRFKKGIPSWNKGKSFGLNSLVKMSISHLGKHQSDKTRKKISDSLLKREPQGYLTHNKRNESRRNSGAPWISEFTKTKISDTLKRKYHNKELVSPFKFRTKEQKRKSSEAARIKLSKKILCINIENGNKIEFDSIIDAEKKLNISRSCIIHNLKGRSKLNKKKYKFSYL